MTTLKPIASLFALIACLLVPVSTFAAGGSISFAKINEETCTLPIPPTGSGATWQYELEGNKEQCQDNQQEFVVFDQFPSASKILLTDSPTCSTELDKDHGFYFLIKTTKKQSTTLQRIQLRHLADFGENKFIYPGFLLEKFGLYDQNQIYQRLSCIRITVSSEKIMPDKDVVVTRAIEWSEGQAEDGSDYTCPSHSFVVGRKHYGDKDGMTQYLCATASGASAYRLKDQEEFTVNERGDQFTCPKHKIMTGRKYEWIDTGPVYKYLSTYRCATLTHDNDKIVNQIRGSWTKQVEETNSTTVCEPNEVMVGRWHTGDDKGHTRIRCARLENTPAPL